MHGSFGFGTTRTIGVKTALDGTFIARLHAPSKGRFRLSLWSGSTLIVRSMDGNRPAYHICGERSLTLKVAAPLRARFVHRRHFEALTFPGVGVAHWDDVERHHRAKGEMDATWQRLGDAAGTKGVGLNRFRVAPGRLPNPPHSHGASEEIYFVLGGSGLAWQDERCPRGACR